MTEQKNTQANDEVATFEALFLNNSTFNKMRDLIVRFEIQKQFQKLSKGTTPIDNELLENIRLNKLLDDAKNLVRSRLDNPQDGYTDEVIEYQLELVVEVLGFAYQAIYKEVESVKERNSLQNRIIIASSMTEARNKLFGE